MKNLPLIKLRNEIEANKAEEQKLMLLTSKPVRVTVQTNKNCNLECVFCGFSNKNKLTKDNEMSPETIEKIARELFPTAREVVPTTLGEPLIYRHWNILVDHIEMYRCFLALYTNGVLLNEKKSLEILPYLSELKLSFDGAIKKTYEELRLKSNYEKVLKNIITFNQLRKNSQYIRPPILTWQFPLMNSNINEFPQAVRLATDLGFDRIAASHVYIFENSLRQENLIFHQEISDEKIKEAIKLSEHLHIELFLPKTFKNETIIPKDFFKNNTCSYLYKEIWIKPNGDVHPCFIPDSPIMGNILKITFEEIWNGELYKKMRATVNTENPYYWRCANCPIRIQFDENYTKNYNYEAFDFSNEKHINIELI